MAVNECTFSAKVCQFRSLLLMVDDGLTKEDLEKLIFLAKDEIGSERETDDIRSGRDLFDILIKRDAINKTCIDYLSDLLARIRRFDLRKELCKKWDAWKHTCPYDIHPPLVPMLHMNQGLLPQQQIQDHSSMNVFRKNPHEPTVPMLKIEGTNVDYDVKDGERPLGKANHQRKESDTLLKMPCQSPMYKNPVSSDLSACVYPIDGKRPPLIHQKCIDVSPTENIYCHEAGGLHCVLPFFGPSDNDRMNHLLGAGSRSSTISTDSLEDQKTGNNILVVRNGRHLSRGSSIGSRSSLFSADSLEEPKTVKYSLSIRAGLRQSPRSSFDSRCSSLSIDSLEEQNSPLLEPDRALRTSVGV